MGGRWVHDARSLFTMPAELLERTRLLFLALMFGSGLALVSQFAVSARPVPERISGVLLVGALLATWTWTYRSGRAGRLLSPGSHPGPDCENHAKRSAK
jgi:hypothetical protein